MDGHPLDGVDLRLARADKHLATLDAKRRAFFGEQDRRIVGYFDREASEYVFRVTGDPPDARIGLVVAEFSHHLRAALDNLLWQLVLLRGGNPTSKTQFPIYESRERYLSSMWMLRGISADDRAFIQWVQPYHLGPEAAHIHPLALVAWLNNTDKHRVLHVGCALPITDPSAAPDGVEIQGAVILVSKDAPADYFPWWPRIIRDVGEVLRVTFSHQAPSDDRTELMRVLIRPTGPDPQMEMQGGEAVDISLSDPKHPLMIHGFQGLRAAVGEIVESLRPRFDI